MLEVKWRSGKIAGRSSAEITMTRVASPENLIKY